MNELLNSKEQEILKRLLRELEPGQLPLDIFLEVAKLTVTPILEVVPLRLKSDKVQVLLFEREKSDPIWGGKLHTPGTIIRASDRGGNLEDAFKRVLGGK